MRASAGRGAKADETKRMIDRVRRSGYREYPKHGMVSRYCAEASVDERSRATDAGVLREGEIFTSGSGIRIVVREQHVDDQPSNSAKRVQATRLGCWIGWRYGRTDARIFGMPHTGFRRDRGGSAYLGIR